jgi:hypothetical protein
MSTTTMEHVDNSATAKRLTAIDVRQMDKPTPTVVTRLMHSHHRRAYARSGGMGVTGTSLGLATATG